jgi:hypothetical protein
LKEINLRDVIRRNTRKSSVIAQSQEALKRGFVVLLYVIYVRKIVQRRRRKSRIVAVFYLIERRPCLDIVMLHEITVSQQKMIFDSLICVKAARRHHFESLNRSAVSSFVMMIPPHTEVGKRRFGIIGVVADKTPQQRLSIGLIQLNGAQRNEIL